MRLLLVGSGGFDASVDFIDLNVKPDELFCQVVDEVRQGKGHCQGFFVALREVKPLFVHGFIAGKPTGITHLLQSMGQAEALDFHLEVPFFCAKANHKSLQANAQKGPCGSWRKRRDCLGFAEDFTDVVRHALDRLDAASGRINGLRIDPEHQAAAVAAAANRVMRGIVELKEIFDRETQRSLIERVTNLVRLVCRFLHRSWNGSEFHLGTNTAMRAGK